jgi:hypothetical protein
VSVQRVLRNTQATLEARFYTGSDLVDADAAVLVDIRRADGTDLALAQATTKPPATTGTYRYTLAPQANLEYFTLDFYGTFGGVVQHHPPIHADIVGAFYVAIADLRAMNGLTSTTTFPQELLEEKRQWFEDVAEREVGFAFVPRYERELLDGDGSGTLWLKRALPRRVLSCKMDGAAQSGLDAWDLYESGRIVRDAGSFPAGRRTVEVTYEHGADEPDVEVRQVAMQAIRARLLTDQSGIPDRMTSYVTEMGTVVRTAPMRPTGIPEVDAVLQKRKLVMVA